MKFAKTINCALAVLVLIILLCGCAKKEDRSQEKSDTNSEINSQSSTVERQINEPEVTTPKASTLPSNGEAIVEDLSSVTEELHEQINRDIEKHIHYIENHGVSQVPPAVQEDLRNSAEYQKASESYKLAKKQGKMNQTEEADKSYRLAAQQYLKVATLHMDADISELTFAAAYQLCKSVSTPSKFDYETAYLLTRYSLIVSPNGRMSEHYRLVSREIEELKTVPTERLRELDQKATELKRN